MKLTRQQLSRRIVMDFRRYLFYPQANNRCLPKSADSLTEEALMYSITKVVSVLSCGVLLCLGLSQAAHAGLSDEAGASRLAQAKVIKGDLVRIDYGDYIIKEKEGQEVRVHMTNKTQTMGQLKKGDRVEAKVDDQNNALLIRPLP